MHRRGTKLRNGSPRVEMMISLITMISSDPQKPGRRHAAQVIGDGLDVAASAAVGAGPSERCCISEQSTKSRSKNEIDQRFREFSRKIS
jgi:hypothetical protein